VLMWAEEGRSLSNSF